MLGQRTSFYREPFRAELQPSTAIRDDIDDLSKDPVNRSPASGGPFVLTVVGKATGAEFRGSTEWWVYGSNNRGLLAFHSLAATRVPVSGADCTEEVAAARVAAQEAEEKRWRAWLGLAPK